MSTLTLHPQSLPLISSAPKLNGITPVHLDITELCTQALADQHPVTQLAPSSPQPTSPKCSVYGCAAAAWDPTPCGRSLCADHSQAEWHPCVTYYVRLSHAKLTPARNRHLPLILHRERPRKYPSGPQLTAALRPPRHHPRLPRRPRRVPAPAQPLGACHHPSSAARRVGVLYRVYGRVQPQSRGGV